MKNYNRNGFNRNWYYEAVFLDNGEVLALLEQMRGSTPLRFLTKDFHVTTAAMPPESHRAWYGKQVNVHITAYKLQDIVDDRGNLTANEGFRAELRTENAELQDYLDSLDKNFHITGAYDDKAKYTEYIDFEDGEKLDVFLSGTFGCGYPNGTIVLSGEV